MAKTTQDINVLSGCSGFLRIDNQDIAEATNITLDVEITREDIQWGLGSGSKIVGIKGTGTITVDKVYTRFIDVYNELIKKGKDKRFDIFVKNEDPDAVDGQIETISINSAWLNSFQLGTGEKSGKQTRDFSIGFNPENSSFADIIK